MIAPNAIEATIKDIGKSTGRQVPPMTKQNMPHWYWSSCFKVSNGDRPDVRNFVILMTDGNANVDEALDPDEVARLIADGTCIMVIGAGRYVNMTQLRRYACQPSTFYVRLYDDQVAMVNDVDALMEEICTSRYNISHSDEAGNVLVFVLWIEALVY